MQLREYQQEAVDACLKDLGAHRRALLCLFTGGGKTLVAMEVMRTMKSALFVTNKIDLAEQSLDRWKSYYGDEQNAGLCVGSRGKYEIKRYTFATVQTASKLDLGKFDVVVIDESHVELSEGEGYYRKLLEAAGQASVLGLTATPFRTGKGYIYGKGKFYPRVTYAKDIKWGVEHGFLVEPRVKAGKDQFNTDKVSTRMGDFDLGELGELVADRAKVSRQVADAIKRMDGRKCVAWSCVNIEHADLVAKTLVDEHGDTALSYHSKTEFRSNRMEQFRAGNFRHLTFVNTVSEGWDHPPLDTMILMRPTRSPGMAIQMIGRTLRPYGDKQDALILDYGEVLKNIGPLDKPIIKEKGERISKSEREEIAAALKICKGCLEYVPRAIRICPDCGFDFFADVIKNVKDRPDFEVDIFSSKTNSRIKWMPVNDVEARFRQSAKGNSMIEVRFKKSVFDGPFAGIRMFILMEPWNRLKAETSIGAISQSRSWEFTNVQSCTVALQNSDVSEILVDETGQWPKVLRVKKKDGREVFVG
jgi:DNA repair protein RadD